MILGTTVGATAWMFAFALKVGDTTTAAILCVVVNCMIGYAIWSQRGKSIAQTKRYMRLHTLLIGLVTALTLNLRFHTWLAVGNSITLAEARQRIPFWAMNLLLGAIFVAIEIMLTVSFGTRRESKSVST